MSRATTRRLEEFCLVQYKIMLFHLRIYTTPKIEKKTTTTTTTTYIQQIFFRLKETATVIFNVPKAGLDCQHCEGQHGIACFSNFRRGVTCI
jgi:regulator of sigma D